MSEETTQSSGIEFQKELLNTIMKNARPTFVDDALRAQTKIEDVIKESVAVNDAYGNKLLSIGTDDKVESFTNYGLDNDSLNWTLWLILYSSSWVFKRAIDKPAQDEVRCGITLQGGNKKFDEIYRKTKKYRFDFIQLLQWGALFGGSIAVMMFDNMKNEDYAKPIDIAKAKQSKAMRMYVVDRWYGVAPSTNETVTDMTSVDFGKPKYYDVTLADGNTIRFHHDFVLRYEHRVAPKLVKNGMLQGWGYAEGSHILNELTRDDKLKASIQSLVDKALIEVIKMSGMRGVFMGADADNEAQLRKRLEMVNWGRSYNSLTFLDKDDEYEQNTFSGLAGLSDLLQNNMWLISSALEMQGVLFGDLKQGFSNDESALERYDETINNRCESYLRPVYEKFLGLLFKLEDIEDKVEFTFNSLLIDKHNKDNMEGMKSYIDLLSQMLGDGVLTTQQYAKAAQMYATDGIVDFGLTDEAISELKDKIEEEMEDITI
jgi:phage-related protein (TIGR01555 family)